ncbi:protein translocase subunit SecD [Candidatus Wolfebacteria bacterium]|nr:protein translocase subunit SecD [Candidatus Wolfebacteria bacterium]
MRRPIFLLFIIILFAIAAVFFVYPNFKAPYNNLNWLEKKLPWKLGLDLIGGTHLVYEIDMSQVSDNDRDFVVSGLRDVIEKRVNLFGVSEPSIVAAKEGNSYRLIVELAGIKNVSEAVNQIGSTPLLEFYETSQVGTSTEFIPTSLTGRYLKGAQMDFDQTTGVPQVSLQFNDEGAKIFEDLTSRNVGKLICVSIDRQIGEGDCARVNEKISGGKAQITGSFSIDEAKKIVSRFNAGALPAPIGLMSQELVGANLGQESLKKAVYGGVVGALMIVAFMIIYYRSFGIYASLALLIYTVLALAIFKLLSITMTLAGIAGFILSIGMAVDANILIFERAKEEIKKGLSRLSAAEEGFRRAWPSIRDSNMSTIITSLILYIFTTGFVKGFGLTLLIGVLVSMFSAITVTKTLMKVFIRSRKEII